MKLLIFWMTGIPNWSEKTSAIVAAENEDAAKACMTCGSDSLWMSVTTCEKIEHLEAKSEELGQCYSQGGAFVLAQH